MDIIEFAEKHGYHLYPVQRVVLKLIYGLRLDDFRRFQVRTHWWGQWEDMTELDYARYLQERGRLCGWDEAPALKVALAAGRRSGKSHLQVLIGAYETKCLIDRDPQWSTGAFYMGPNMSQSELVFNGFQDFAEESNVLSARLANRQRHRYTFQTNGDIERDGPWKGSRRQARASVQVAAMSSSVKALRGHNMGVVFLDEFAYFPEASAGLILNVIRPALAVSNGKLFMFSSPSPKADVFRHEFQDSEGLSLRIPTWEMNPTVPDTEFHRAWEQNGAITFDIEYGAKFMSTVDVDLDDGLVAGLQELADARGQRLEDMLYQILDEQLRELVDGGDGGI